MAGYKNDSTPHRDDDEENVRSTLIHVPDHSHPDDVKVKQPGKMKFQDGSSGSKKRGGGGRSTLEWILIGLLVIFIILFIVFLILFIVNYSEGEPVPTDHDAPCMTKECVLASAQLLSNMDPTVDPCVDFYEYACGGWMQKQHLAPDEGQKGLAESISETNRMQLKDFLESKKDPNEPHYLKQPKDFYAACMDIDAMDAKGADPFLDLVSDVGKYPVLSTHWTASDFQVERYIFRLIKHGIRPLFTVAVARDPFQADLYRILVQDARPGVPQGERNSSAVRRYEKYLVDLTMLLGANKTEAEEDMKKAVDLEVEIRDLMRSPVEKQDFDSTYNLMTIRELQNNYSYVNWMDILQGVGNAFSYGVTLTEDDVILVPELAYMEKVGPLITNTDSRVLANYMLSALSVTYADFLGTKFLDLKQQYDLDMKGTEPSARWKRCTDEATLLFGEAMGRMYVDKYFTKEAEDDLNEMIVELKESFAELLKNNAWLSEDAKQVALGKLKLMHPIIGYPAYIKNDDRLNSVRSKIPTARDKYMESIVALLEVDNARQINYTQLREPSTMFIWPPNASPAVVNAFNSPYTNEILFPAAFLQQPSYSPAYTSSMNYGGVGMVIGHEITHGYDTKGRLYDAKGVMEDWWAPEDLQRFISRAKCFVDQYSSYKWGDYEINGQLTLGENIADNGGLKESYYAYKNHIKKRGSEEPKLPGLDLNHDQIFFLSFAQLWCIKARDEHKKESVTTDPHSPGQVRVIGTLHNSKEFANTFKCPVGSKMNPIEKCELW